MHLKIENVSLAETRKDEGWARIQFDISWDKSWKNKVNCDGVWFFAKFREGDGPWKHVDLKAKSKKDFDYTDQAPEGFSKGSGADTGMWVPETKKGGFIFRTKGEGSVKSGKVTLVWDCSQAGVKDFSGVEVKVFGVEMVYVPQDRFCLGDPDGPDGPANCFYVYYNNGPYLVQSEDEIRVAEEEDHLYCGRVAGPVGKNSRFDEPPFTIPATFPKGYAAFWVTKYELSTQHYVDFLNCLTRGQQKNHVAADISKDTVENTHVMSNTKEETLRQSITCPASGNGTDKPVVFSTNAPARACNIICWADSMAYASWAGLRPITEMEYEKANRGTADPIPYEFSWGSTRMGRIEGVEGKDGSGYEIKLPKNKLVNCCVDGGIGPMHRGKQKKPKHPGLLGPVSCGVFSNSMVEGYSERENSGASFYGAMELCGNVWITCVSVGHEVGRSFTRVHGDGTLDEDGYANISTWPDKNAEGTGARGGVWVSPGCIYVCMARRQAGYHPKSERRMNGGIRLGF